MDFWRVGKVILCGQPSLDSMRRYLSYLTTSSPFWHSIFNNYLNWACSKLLTLFDHAFRSSALVTFAVLRNASCNSRQEFRILILIRLMIFWCTTRPSGLLWRLQSPTLMKRRPFWSHLQHPQMSKLGAMIRPLGKMELQMSKTLSQLSRLAIIKRHDLANGTLRSKPRSS